MYSERRWLLPLLVALVGAGAVILVVAALTTPANPGGYGWMMGGNGSWAWMWGAGALMMAIPLIFLILLFTLILRPLSPQPAVVTTASPANPLAELRVRYARGEITAEQYRQVLGDLQRH
jgi:uncharacterized membrane protein